MLRVDVSAQVYADIVRRGLPGLRLAVQKVLSGMSE